MKHLAAVGLFLTLAVPALGQGMEFQQLLSGQDFPLNLKLKELNSDWRRLSVATLEAPKGGMGDTLSQLMQAGMMSEMGKNKGKDDAAAAMLGMSLLGGLFGGGGESKPPVYYTRGQTAAVGGETFLIAYRYQKPEMGLMQMAMQAAKQGKEPGDPEMAAAGKLSAESSLALSLINTRTITRLDDIRPFDMNQEIAESAQEGGGLMDLIAQQKAKEAAEPKPSPKPTSKAAAPRKPVARPKSRP